MMKRRIPILDLSENKLRTKLPSLSELLPPERIKLDVKVINWQGAIHEVGKLLFNSGAVTSEYIDAMVKVAEELGPYFVIAPGIALPHAATEAGAKQTALSMIKLSNPIYFGNPENDPVKLVFGLSAIDKKAHMVALRALAELFLSKELVKELLEVESINSVVNIINKAEKLIE